MQATHPDAFALRNSGLGTFLYADVGTELNGSMLSVLSMLARRGKDPWAEAAKWVALPRESVIDSLAESIDQMPLAPALLAASRATAARLAELLPAHTESVRQGEAAGAKIASKLPKWGPVTILCVLAVGMALNALFMHQHSFAPNEEPGTVANSLAPGSIRQPVPGSSE